jgi:fused signal recognition particle receptor
MVFDWFRRRTTPQAETPADSPAPEVGVSGSDSDLEAVAPEAEKGAMAPLGQEDPPAAPPPSPGEAASPAVADVPSTAGGVDQEALEWARQAYARLKAQQQAASSTPAVAPSPSPAVAPASASAPLPTPVASPPAPTPPVEGPAGAQEPESEGLQSPVVWAAAIAAPSPPGPSADFSLSAPAPAAPAPAEGLVPAPAAPVPTEGLAPAAPGRSLLELAAAQRQQRLQELTAEETPAGSDGLSAPGGLPGAAVAGASVPATAGDDPQLGAFDDTFTWSAEVLAAQGRSVEQVSLEEIDWLGRLRRGLEKTRRGFVTQLLDSLGDDPLTPEVIDDLETTLLRADVGVQATDQVLAALRQRLNEEVVDPAEGLRFLKEQLRGLLEAPISASGRELLVPERGRLNVWLLVGVNGVGKTTTLGKLANLAVRSGYSCLIAAADTFRAAAVQQVSVWGERSGVQVISNPTANADPAAVVYDAIGAAQAKGCELVLVDTAGRLQTKHNLMEELAKVRRIVDKLAPEAAVESLLVLDASQGQNGLKQAMAFAQAAGLTGVVLTKLDGSARGGVALAVASEAKLPIRFIGAGETIRDLRPFNSFEFVEALLAS